MGRTFRYRSSITLTTKDGRSFNRTELHRRGTLENPPHPGDVEKKFRTLVRTAMDDDSLQRLLLFIRDLENKGSLDELFGIVGRVNSLLADPMFGIYESINDLLEYVTSVKEVKPL